MVAFPIHVDFPRKRNFRKIKSDEANVVEEETNETSLLMAIKDDNHEVLMEGSVRAMGCPIHRYYSTSRLRTVVMLDNMLINHENT